MENLLNYTFYENVFAFWGIILTFIIILFICEATQSGYWAMTSFFIVAVALYYWSNFNPLDYISFSKIAIYLGIGLVFSIIRCYFHARRIRNNVIAKRAGNQQELLDQAKSDIKSELQNNVFRWWFMWPASLLYWIFSDLVKDAYDWVYLKLASTFNKVVDRAFR